MTAISGRVLFWTPRVLGIAFAIFLSMFALDVFSEGYSFWQTLGALMIHLVPTAIIVAVLVVAWRWEWIGAVLFAAAALFYLVTTLKHPDWILAISGPLFLIAALFLVNWFKRAELHGTHRHTTV
jgi:hypothetical protein